MFPLRMFHPQHGLHHANNSLEEATMRSNGWLPEPSKVAGPPGTPPELLAPGVPSIQEKKGPGRPRKVIA
jgi:hypothetical protein